MTYAIEEMHVAVGADSLVRLVLYELLTEHPLVSLPARCPDCSQGPPHTVTPAPGYDAAFVVAHETTCPAFLAALHSEGDP